MTDHRTPAILSLAAAVLIALAPGDRAWAQARSKTGPGRPVRTTPAPRPAVQAPPPAEIKARQDLERAQQLAQAGGHDADAIAAARSALEGHIKPGPGKPDDLTIEALSLLVNLHTRAGRLAEEVAVRRERLDAWKQVFDNGHWRIRDEVDGLADAERRLASTPERRHRLAEASGSLRRAFALANAGRLGEALPHAVKATEIYREVEGNDHRNVATTLVLRGNIHRVQRDYATAGSMYEQALLVRRKVLGENHPDTIFVLQKMAELAEARGDVPQAARLFERAVELDAQNAANEIARAQLYETIARLLELQGDHAGARPYLERASAVREQLAFVDAREDPFSRGALGMGRSESRLGGAYSGFAGGLGGGYGGMGGPFGGQRSPLGGLGLGIDRQRTTRERPSRFGFDSHLDDMAGFGRRPMFGSQQADDNMAMTHHPTHPWTLRLRSMRMYIHAAGGKELKQVESIASAFERGVIRGDAWVAYARNLGLLADVAEAQGEAEKRGCCASARSRSASKRPTPRSQPRGRTPSSSTGSSR